MFPILRTAFVLFVLLTGITGLAYPLSVLLIAQGLFPHQANGSLFSAPGTATKSVSHSNSQNLQSDSTDQKKWMGSELVGQTFSDPKYFWGRPSATAPVTYNGLGGSGSNQAPSNPALVDTVRDRIAKLRQEDPDNLAAIPVDLVTASGSGLDPHISEAAAKYQAGRIARLRNLDADTITKLVFRHTERPTFGVLGQSRVNVLRLNLALNELAPPPTVNNLIQ